MGKYKTPARKGMTADDVIQAVYNSLLKPKEDVIKLLKKENENNVSNDAGIRIPDEARRFANILKSNINAIEMALKLKSRSNIDDLHKSLMDTIKINFSIHDDSKMLIKDSQLIYNLDFPEIPIQKINKLITLLTNKVGILLEKGATINVIKEQIGEDANTLLDILKHYVEEYEIYADSLYYAITSSRYGNKSFKTNISYLRSIKSSVSIKEIINGLIRYNKLALDIFYKQFSSPFDQNVKLAVNTLVDNKYLLEKIKKYELWDQVPEETRKDIQKYIFKQTDFIQKLKKSIKSAEANIRSNGIQIIVTDKSGKMNDREIEIYKQRVGESEKMRRLGICDQMTNDILVALAILLELKNWIA